MRLRATKYSGFTLIEMAVAVFVIALLLGSILVPLTTQVEQRKISDTRRALEEIREALIGFAIINGRFPCPDTDIDPAAAGYGLEEAMCPAPAAEGYLPWKTLGATEMDAWGIKRTASGSPRIGDWRYRVDRNFSVAFGLTTACSSLDQLRVQDAAGSALHSTAACNTLPNAPERPVVIVYSAGPNTTPDGQNATYEANNGVYQADVHTAVFDDILIWISRPILFNRMIAAGRLP